MSFASASEEAKDGEYEGEHVEDEKDTGRCSLSWVFHIRMCLSVCKVLIDEIKQCKRMCRRSCLCISIARFRSVPNSPNFILGRAFYVTRTLPFRVRPEDRKIAMKPRAGGLGLMMSLSVLWRGDGERR
jgi:hypothetical protein